MKNVEHYNRNNISYSRIVISVIFMIIIYIFLLAILYNISIVNNDFYEHLSLLNVANIIYTPAVRGNILDRNSVKLTNSRINYLMYISKQDYYEINNNNNNNNSSSNGKYITFFKRSDWKKIINTVEKISINGHFAIDNNYIREYLYPDSLSHIIGFTAKPSAEEVVKTKLPKPLLLHDDYKVGKSGIEKIYNKYLTGVHGEKYTIGSTNVIENVKPISGKDLKLTIDIKLQEFIKEKTKDTGKSVVIVMNVNTGEVLGMISNPTFNTNLLVKENYYKNLLNDPDKPIINRAVNAFYSPGSTFKLIIAITALKNGWDPRKNVTCKGEKNIGKNRVLHCWKEKGHGTLNLVEAIKHSCNIYFSEVGIFAGIDNIYDTALDFGFGNKFDLELPDVKTSVMPSKEWKKKKYNESWTFGDTVNISIGQGFLSVTPLELVVMTSRIANDGYPVRPTIIKDSQIVNDNKKLFQNNSKIVDGRVLNIIKEGMYKVVNEMGGTVYYNRIKKSGMEMAGKTGTTQVINKNTMETLIKSGKDVRNFDNHALFVGFAPFNNPKYAIVVIVEYGKSGSGNAAPIARDVLEFAQKNDI